MRPLHLTATALVTALGRGAAAHLDALEARRCGLIACDFEDADVGGHIGRVAGLEAHSLPTDLARFDCRNNRLADLTLAVDGFAAAVAAARDRLGADRIAVLVGTSTSGVLSSEAAYRQRDPNTGALPAGYDSAHTHDMYSLARFVRARLGLTGPAMVISTACASSALSFVEAHRLIEAGVCDAAVIGGVDTLCGMTLHGFAALDLISALPCRPCDVARGGISIGEAGGFALVERAGPGLALLGYGVSSDGHHMSAPHPQGAGAIAAMRQALAQGGLVAADIDYINLHGTGTRANDAAEDLAVYAVFADAVPVSSTKGFTGHSLGAAGIMDALIAGICLERGLVPGCLNVTQVDPAFRSSVVAENSRRDLRRVVSNSFGFGGVNCSLVLGFSP